MRSLLFIPADSDRKLSKGAASGADALILDLEDAVASENKPAARRMTLDYLKTGRSPEQKIVVRINALDTGLTTTDLAAIVAGKPDAVLLPKSGGGHDIRTVDNYLSALEAREGIEPGFVGIYAVATETAGAMFGLGTYAGASPRLRGLMWGEEDLAADLGAVGNRHPDGTRSDPYRLARTLCLMGSVAAGCDAVDGIYADFRNEKAFEAECRASVIDGFVCKTAIHPSQVPIINKVFMPSPADITYAERVVQAFAQSGTGITSLDGRMLDRPHLRQAQKVLLRAGRV